jgi:hypothetical protein
MMRSCCTLLFCAAMLVGCCVSRPMQRSTAVDIDTEIAKAADANTPMVLLIGDFGPGGDDEKDRHLLSDPVIVSRSQGVKLLAIDLSVSSNRAMAARYHIAKPPILVCLSPMGLIVSRDEAPLTPTLAVKRMDGLPRRAAALDQTFSRLKDLLDNQRDITAKTGVEPGVQSRGKPIAPIAAFLLDHHNDLQAIPYLYELSSSDSVSIKQRVDAWVSLARARLWIAEPEKARHEARNLIETLGPQFSDAVAGGNFVLGLQDAIAKRFGLARQEFQAAVTASPESVYAKQATIELAKLPKDTQ